MPIFTDIVNPASSESQEFLKRLGAEILEKIRRENVQRRQHASEGQMRSDIETMVSLDYQLYKLKVIERDTGISLRGKRLLEIGAGLGFFVIVARSLGVDAYGIEPYKDFYEEDKRFAEKMAAHFALAPGTITHDFAERMSFPDNSFDVVSSYYSLEHVNDPALALKECLRVAKSGGFIHAVFPNYGSLWEGHYAVPWIPGLNRVWGARYIKWVWRRSPHIIEHLNLFNERKVLSLLRELGPSAQCLTLGRETFEREVSTLTFNPTGSIHSMLRLLRALKMTGILTPIVRILSALRLYTPFYLTLRKRP